MNRYLICTFLIGLHELNLFSIFLNPSIKYLRNEKFNYICSLCNRVIFFSQSNLKFENKYKFFALEIDMYMYMFPNMYDVL